MLLKITINIWLLLQIIAEVKLSQLPTPQNVRVESENLHNVLHWNSVTETPAVEYTVQYYFDHVIGWKDAPSCAPTSAVHCDFTSVARPPVKLTLRVRAQSMNQTSAWSTTKPFSAREETRLGPPGITLSPSPSALLVQISDSSPLLKAEFGDSLKYRVFYWEQSDVQKEHLDGVSSIITLKPLTAGGQYCVQVQYVLFRRREGDRSTPVCATVPESGDGAFKRTAWILVVVVLLGMVICAGLISIHKNYDFLKKALRPSIGLPEHIYQFFEREEFDQLSESNASTPDSVESVMFVTEDEEEEEAEPSSPDYTSSLQECSDPPPASTSPD